MRAVGRADHSGSNYSFVGTKLWLLWDTFEGFANGLEDVERCTVYDRAAFDMEAFLAMRSSRWIFIRPLCLSQIKSGHICDAVRRGLGGKEYALPS